MSPEGVWMAVPMPGTLTFTAFGCETLTELADLLEREFTTLDTMEQVPSNDGICKKSRYVSRYREIKTHRTEKLESEKHTTGGLVGPRDTFSLPCSGGVASLRGAVGFLPTIAGKYI